MSPNAATLLASIVQSLEARDSLSARVHVHVNMFGQQMVGSGVYLEQAPSRLHRMRLEINLQTREKPASLLQVCDGSGLFTFTQMSGEVRLGRVDVAHVLAASSAAGQSPGPAQPPRWPGLGGLPRLIRQLRQSFDFQSVAPDQLVQLGVWRIEGAWKPERLAALAPEQKPAIERGQDLSKLPPQLPTHAVIFVGQDDLVPYRIEYRRARHLGRLDPGDTLLLALQLSEVSLNIPLADNCFTLQTGEMGPVDDTEAFLREAGLK